MLERPNPDAINNRAGYARFLGDLVTPPTADQHQHADSIAYFHGIDLLRGLAAVSILIWHYQHFYFTGAPVHRSLQPLYVLLWPIYENGFWAVDLFWVISGFVFSHVYASKETTAAAFAQARFSRLYPLHFITLVVITALQSISFSLTGAYQLFSPADDPVGFAQQLLFISAWGFPHGGHFFNSPVWSVSIEMLIYGVFFFTARRVLSFGILVPVSIAGICWLLIHGPGGPTQNFPMCGFFFFAGVAIYCWVVKFQHSRWLIIGPSAIGAAIFIYLVASGRSEYMRYYNVNFFLFGPLVLLVGWAELFVPFRTLIRPVKWFGDTTYSTYLWHFPIQVGILIIFAYYGLDHSVFNKPVVFFAWVIGMVVLAHLSFKYFERLAQNYIKSKFRAASLIPPRADIRRRQWQ